MSRTVSLFELVKSLSQAMDLICPAVASHHVRVGVLSDRLARALGFSEAKRRDLLLAGLMHDAGAFSLQGRLEALEFETDGRAHAEAGYRLVAGYPRLARPGLYIRHHHDAYSDILSSDGDIPREANILCLADRVDVLIRRERDIAPQLPEIAKRIARRSGGRFAPEYVEAFLDIFQDPEFLHCAERPAEYLDQLSETAPDGDALDLSEAVECSRLFSQVIDFRSRFTATHSSGVAATAAALARLHGFSPSDVELMHVAGNLHDLGKLAVPEAILDKAGPLTDEEWKVMRDHPGHSLKVLKGVSGLGEAVHWAADHHERLDGKGYPGSVDGSELSEGSRIVAVSDVFTAITEDRPYRAGMSRSRAGEVLDSMAGKALDGDTVSLLLKNYDELNGARITAQRQAARDFDGFYTPAQAFSNARQPLIIGRGG